MAASCLVAACGSGGEASGPAKLVIETSDRGPDRVVMRAPAQVDAGLVTIELRNRGDMPHDAQLFAVDGDRTADDVVTVLEQADPVAKPSWLHPRGGVAPTRPGETARVAQVLEPGVYFAADTQERVDPSGAKLTNATKHGIVKFVVDGDTGDAELPPASASITATDDGIATTGIAAGTNRVTFRNEGDEYHQAVAFPIPRGEPFAAGERKLLERAAEIGWVPVPVPHDRATTVLEGGEAQVTRLRLRPGRYVLLCFVSERAGGPAQWMLGVESRLDVPRRPSRAAAGPPS